MPGISLSPVVSFNESPMADSWQNALSEMRIDHRMQVPARCLLRFSDPGYVLAQDTPASLATTVKVVDPIDDAEVLFDGEVTSVAVEQQMGEQPEVVLVAHDKSHRLGRSHSVKARQQMTASDVVSELASDASLSIGQVDTTSETYSWALQSDTDLGLLTELARRNGRDWWVAEGSLYFVKPDASDTASFTLSETLLALSVKASGMYPSEVNVRGWDYSQKQALVGTSTSSDAVVASSTLADLTDGASSLGSAELSFASLSVGEQAEADTLSSALSNRAGSSAVSAQGVTYGTGKIKLGKTVKVEDSGPLAGTYPVTRVEHTFRPKSGFLTRFYSGDRWPTTLVDTLSNGSSGGSSLHNGLVVATVSSVKDPNGTGMVQVSYPGLDDSLVSDWGRVALPGAGSDWGSVFIPEVNSEVLVGFEGGNLSRPIVLGGLYNGQDAMPAITSDTDLIDDGSGAVNWRGIKSRTGHVFLLNDASGEGAGITIQTGDGNNSVVLMVSGDDKGITIKTTNDVNIQGNNCSITAQQNLTLKGEQQISLQSPQIQISADSQFSVSSDGTLSIQSEGSASLQGADLTLEGEGSATLSAPTISIGS